MSKPMGDYLTTDEAAKILDVTTEAIRYRARQGDLGAVKRGGIWWVKHDRVVELKRELQTQERRGPRPS